MSCMEYRALWAGASVALTLAFSDMPVCEVLHTSQGEMTRPQPRASPRWRPSLRTCGVPERKAPLRVGPKVDGVRPQ